MRRAHHGQTDARINSLGRLEARYVKERIAASLTDQCGDPVEESVLAVVDLVRAAG